VKIDFLTMPSSWRTFEVSPTTSQRLQQSWNWSRIAVTIVFSETEMLQARAGDVDGHRMNSSGNATIVTCKSALGAVRRSMADRGGLLAS